MPRIFVMLLLTAGLYACASTSNEVEDSGDGAATAKSEQPKMRCYRDKSTGTRLGERVCVPITD